MLRAVTVLSVAALCSAVTVDVLHPIRDGTEAAILIAPGASIAGSAYAPLAQTLQKVSPLKLWVVLLDNFLIGAVNPPQLSQAVGMATTALKQAGFKSDNIFLAGHSLGGAMTSMYAGGKTSLKGAILFASYVTNGHHLHSYPVPVLTISGDLDGLTRVTRIVSSLEDLESTSDPNRIYRTPIIVMPGINHAQFASGAMPSNVVNHDLRAEVSEADAHKTIAQYTSAFVIATVTGVDAQLVRDAKQTLADGYNMTKEILQPLMTVKELDQNKQAISHWTIKAQSMLINSMDQSLHFHITNHEESLATLGFAHPTATLKHSDVFLSTYTTVSLPLNPIDASTGPQSPTQLQAKMKSQEEVKTLAKSAVFNDSPSCKDINIEAYKFALAMSSKRAVARFNASGRNFTFLEDTQTSSGPQWLAGSLSLKYLEKTLVVKSVALKTGLNVIFSSFAGQNYCKLLSPFRAMEYIYIDCMVPVQ